MTDLPIATHEVTRSQRLLAFRLSPFIPFRGLAPMLEAYGRALDLAYVQPYRKGATGPTATSDEDGRNPEW
jgi:hypothetical protein